MPTITGTLTTTPQQRASVREASNLFHVGDSVKIVDNLRDFNTEDLPGLNEDMIALAGRNTTITGINRETGYIMLSNSSYVWSGKWLELITSTTTKENTTKEKQEFKPGDKVIVLTCSANTPEHINQIGEIVKVNSSDYTSINVKLEDKSIFDNCCTATKVILLTPEALAEIKAKEKARIAKEKEEKRLLALAIKKNPFLAYKFGVEIECIMPYSESSFEDQLNSTKWKTSEDGSIDAEDNAGIEVKTNGAVSYSDLQTNIKELCQLMSDNSVYTNSSCGYHVHISNNNFFDNLYIQRLILVWASIEDILLATQPRSRLNNQYCRRYLKKFIDDKTKNTDKMPKGKEKLISKLGSTDRYTALNLSSLKKHGTIEVRLHAGTVNKEKILNWVNLLLSIYEYTDKRYNKNELLELFTTPISQTKIDKVFSMLKLPDELARFYNSRINKFTFAVLEKQQTSASKLMRALPTLKKAEKAYLKTVEKQNLAYSRKETLKNNYRKEYDALLGS